MFRLWTTLLIIVMVDLPVAMDATILHVAAPTLSLALQVSNQQLLWIIDIYPLMMAGLVLPMGALGDRIGFKRLLMLGGALFSIASLAAGLVTTAGGLIAARALLALGAAMIVPATLAGIRVSFSRPQDRNLALGVWAAVSSGGAAFGPLAGGLLLEHFYWGSVFLINVPIVLAALVLTAFGVPAAPQDNNRKLNFGHALMLIAAILLMVFGLKSALKSTLEWYAPLSAASGAVLLWAFVRLQRRSESPLLDLSLFRYRVILSGITMAVTAMVALVGAELLIAQELQFVHNMTPFAAGTFMLPVMIASGLSGPIAGLLMSRIGLRQVATGGMALSALSLAGLAMTDFSTQQYFVWGWMALLGFSASSALLAGTSAIMATAPKEKAASAGAIETMAYELGAGMGIALFGLVLGRSYQATITLPAWLSQEQTLRASASIGEASQVANRIGGQMSNEVMAAAQQAFISAHGVVLAGAAIMLLLLAVAINMSLKSSEPATA